MNSINKPKWKSNKRKMKGFKDFLLSNLTLINNSFPR